MPTAVHMDEVFLSAAFKELEAVSAHQPFAETPHKRAVLAEHQKGVLRVVGDQIQQAVPPFGHGVAVDHRRHGRIRFAPREIHAVTVAAVADLGVLGDRLGG